MDCSSVLQAAQTDFGMIWKIWKALGWGTKPKLICSDGKSRTRSRIIKINFCTADCGFRREEKVSEVKQLSVKPLLERRWGRWGSGLCFRACPSIVGWLIEKGKWGRSLPAKGFILPQPSLGAWSVDSPWSSPAALFQQSWRLAAAATHASKPLSRLSWVCKPCHPHLPSHLPPCL